MAKSQKRSNREPKKPKTAGKKVVAPSPFIDASPPVKKKAAPAAP